MSHSHKAEAQANQVQPEQVLLVQSSEINVGQLVGVGGRHVGIEAAASAVNFEGVGSLGGRMFARILAHLGSDLSGQSKKEFTDKVVAIYDAMIAPAIVGLGPWGIVVNPLVRTIVSSLAGLFYDSHSKPK